MIPPVTELPLVGKLRDNLSYRRSTRKRARTYQESGAITNPGQTNIKPSQAESAYSTANLHDSNSIRGQNQDTGSDERRECKVQERPAAAQWQSALCMSSSSIVLRAWVRTSVKTTQAYGLSCFHGLVSPA